VIIYQGPSVLDGAPIVVLAMKPRASGANKKTGAMVQTYILRSDMSPIEAVRTGADASICGDCRHRGDGTGKGRSCYVTLIHGPRVVYDAYSRGIYETVTPAQAGLIFAGSMVRLGTYGDPAAVPQDVWQALTAHAEGWTGYTHQWRTIDPSWARYVMASTDSMAERWAAEAMGYRSFRVGAEPEYGEVICPASEEAGRKVQCIACKACMGTSGKARAPITIAPHGVGARHVTTHTA
jgi:hypothetical protein